MTVAELIATLKGLPPNTQVVVEDELCRHTDRTGYEPATGALVDAFHTGKYERKNEAPEGHTEKPVRVFLIQ